MYVMSKAYCLVNQIYIRSNMIFLWLCSVHCVSPMTGRGCASVLNTHLSKGISESSENKRYKYFKVSAKKKLCWTSSCCTGTLSTSRIPEKPTPISQCFLIA